MAGGTARLDEDRLASARVTGRPIEGGDALAPGGHVHAVGPLQPRRQRWVSRHKPLGPALAVGSQLLLARDAFEVLADAAAQGVALLPIWEALQAADEDEQVRSVLRRRQLLQGVDAG